MTLGDLVAAEEHLGAENLAHLGHLTGTWDLLADLSFGDLVLYLRAGDDSLVVADHIRPTTSQTIYRADLLGETRRFDQRPIIAEALHSGQRCMGTIESAWLADEVDVEAIPVRRQLSGTPIAVLAREGSTSGAREAGQLESVYSRVFGRFGDMISAGRFPYATWAEPLPDAPRVGDGVLVVDRDGRVEFASPNARSVLIRSGIPGRIVGRTMAELGLGAGLLGELRVTRAPVSDELELAGRVVVSTAALPLLTGQESPDASMDGAVLLVRDVTDLRRRDRLLLSKDATIREIHHRVKNNLQTISSLLRLQGRRLEEPTAQAAIGEAVRRIRSIALVHEVLSHEAGDDVEFSEVLRPLVRMIEESLTDSARPLRTEVVGTAGVVSSPMATALAIVLTELLQNVVEHAYGAVAPTGRAASFARIELANDGDIIAIVVSDDGPGLPVGFDPNRSLGLTIVDSLVRTELGGRIEFELGDGRDEPHRSGTTVRMWVPAAGGHG
jgi:two-component sensor histidine kinase